jgi:hypothetical protein
MHETERDYLRPKACDAGAPQLVVTELTHAVLVATYRALHRAHPILAALASSVRQAPFADHELSDAEHFAQLVLLAIDDLAERLDDYTASVAGEDDDIHEDIFPF